MVSKMEIITKIADIQYISQQIKKNGNTVGVVPTMGYLHKGHLSLIEKAKNETDKVITTLFVNPTQFAPNEDFDAYPRDFERDCNLAEDAGSDFIFAPETSEMYPKNFITSINIKGITSKFEGASRPNHFNGVALIVAKLFNATLPDVAVFGQKDLQQTLVIKALVRDLNFPIKIVIAPTMREANGLAMSSRNKYLSEENRKKAGIIFKALEDASHAIYRGEIERKRINAFLHKTLRTLPEIQIDYACAADADTFAEPEEFLPGENIALMIAVHLGKTRLIDNALVKIPSQLNDSNFIEGI